MDKKEPQKAKLSVLVVEDHFINQELMKEMLDRLNCSVDTAQNGQEALHQIDVKNYDIIFMDLQMPEMDGFEATREIRKKGHGKSSVPIIALTANAMQGDRGKCLEAGMDDYLSKPFEVRDIEAILNKYFPH
ncbi:MAG: Sensor histidine kinase RcsC [Chlamydiae bacterium]|nr:Sensor histidine kinase RcsC [Chlamydiota bacterium]